MTLVTMRKAGETDIQVDSTNVTAHEQLGWKRAEIEYGQYELTVPSGAQVNVESGGNEITAGALATASITVAAQIGDVKHVTIQLQDENGADLAVRASILAFLTSASAGEIATATAPDGGVAIGTDGGCIHLVTDKVFLLTSEADGDVDLDLTEAGAGTWYLVLVMPSGERVVSGAITFV